MVSCKIICLLNVQINDNNLHIRRFEKPLF